MATLHNKYVQAGSGDATKALYASIAYNFSRGNPVPLDETSYFESLTDAQNYAISGATAYVGQILTVVES